MPSLLLKVHKIAWDKTGLPSFLQDGDIPADCLADLKTEKNELSVWYIEDDGANLNRVITALAASCSFVSSFDYLLFDHNIVNDLGLTINKTDGETPDDVANRSWHRDLTNLSSQNVLEFASAVFNQSSVQRIPEKTIGEWLKRAVANGEVDSSKLTQKLAAKVLTAPVPPVAASPVAASPVAVPPVADQVAVRVAKFLRMCRQIGSAVKDAWQEFRRG